MQKARFRTLVKWAIIACVVMVAAAGVIALGENSVSATPGNTGACTNCHSLRAGNLRITTDTTTKTVAPGASFVVNTSWTGGGGSLTEVNWPNVNSNTLFTPTPRVPYSNNGTTGTIATTLTAPATAGTYTVTVYATQMTPKMETDYKDMAITVAAAPVAPVVSTASLANGTVGTAYSQTLAATGGTTPYAWTVSTGTLPAGLSLSTGGVISGTPTAAATSNFTVQVSGGGTDTQALSILVNPAALSVTTTSLSNGTVGTAYSQTLAASGGTLPRTWTVSAGSLPAGLSLSTGGVISGTPTAAATSNFTVQVSGGGTATKALSILVNPAALSVTTASLPAGTVGAAYSQTLAATGGTTPYTWTVSAGTLPAGLSLSTGGVISGTPTAAATSNFTVQVSGGGTATKALSILVNPAALSVTTASLPAGTVGAAYSQTLAATGGTTPYTWTVSAGALPAGLSLSTGGVISGTPTAAATSNFTVQVSGGGTATKALSILVNPAALSVTTASLPAGTVGAAYSQTLTATGGTTPYTWTVSAGALPAGLSLSTGGLVSGTPTAVATSNFTVQVSGGGTATKALSITVNSAPVALSVTTASLPNGTVGTAYSQTLGATGGTTPYTWTVSAGTLPAGLSLSTAGVISGTPTAAATSNFTVQVSGGGTATKALSITVDAAPVVPVALGVTTTSLPNGTVGTAYNQSLSATGGTVPYSWTVSAGSLPAGLSLSTAGAITGTPTAAATSNFTVQVSGGGTATQALSITIDAAVVPIPPPPSSPISMEMENVSMDPGLRGSFYSYKHDVAGGTAPYTWSILSGSLPDGLNLDASTGVISGRPSVAGTSSFTLGVVDGNGNATSMTMSITIYGSHHTQYRDSESDDSYSSRNGEYSGSDSYSSRNSEYSGSDSYSYSDSETNSSYRDN